ncbi:MAG: sigma-70 family RNA polymerase sigma factor [Thermoguttaceae bacterium]|nr:sigma-70 family RNA polymerase sigma factor [Thermoguttaceae bacterium]
MTEQKRHLTRDEATSLFLRHYDFIRGVAFRHAPSRSLQEDIVNDVYIDFIEKYDQWNVDPNNLRPLFRKITQNIALQYWRDWVKNLPENVQKLLDYIWQKEQPKTGEECAMLREELHALESCLDKLKPENRELIELLYLKNLSYAELIERTGQKAGTIYSLMSRIRARLQICVDRTMNVEVSDV